MQLGLLLPVTTLCSLQSVVLGIFSGWLLELPHLAHILQEPWELRACVNPWLMCFSEKSLLKEALSPQEVQRRQHSVASWSLFYNLDKRSPLILELKKPVVECWRKLSFDLWALAGRWEGPRMSRAIWPQTDGRGCSLLTCFDP